MKVRNIGERDIICKEGKLSPSCTLDMPEKDAKFLVHIFEGEVELVAAPVIEESKKRKVFNNKKRS